jgi:Fe-S cluster assembly protein SufB
MTNSLEDPNRSVPPADVLAKTVWQRSIANSEPQWLVHARREALDAYLSLAPEDNQRRISRQLLLGQTAKDDIPDEPHTSTPSTGAAADSEIANRIRSDRLKAKGVILMDLRRAVIEHSGLVREHLGSLMDPTMKWTEALNAAIWTRGHFVHIPKSIRVETAFQPYDRTNASRMGPFERTLIVAAPSSSFDFVEGCSAPIFTSDSFRAPLTEVVVHEGASVTHATIGNYTRNVVTTVNRRAGVRSGGSMMWIEGELGPASSIGVPAIELSGTGARGEIMALRLAGLGSRAMELGGDVSFCAPGT